MEHAATAEPDPARGPAVLAAGHTTIAGLSQGNLLRLMSHGLETQAACHPHPGAQQISEPTESLFYKESVPGAVTVII